MADGFDLEQFKETSPPPSEGFDLDKYKEASVPTEAEAAAHPPVAPPPTVGPRAATPQEKELSNQYKNMYIAQTGQGRNLSTEPMLSPEERKSAEAGRKEGMISAGVTTASDLALPGILGPVGRGIEKVLPAGPTESLLPRVVKGALHGGTYGAGYGVINAVTHPGETLAHPLEAATKIGEATAGGALVGGVPPIVTTAGRSMLGRVARIGAEAAPTVANAAPTPPASASTPVAGPPRPLSNAQIGTRIEQGVKEAAGTPPIQPGQPIYARPIQGTVGAKTVAEMPNTEVAGPPIATPSRNQTLTNYAGENVEKAAARTPMTPRNENAFYKDFSPRERQDIHTNMEVRTPNGYEPIPNAENHWERLSKTPEVREDLFKMENDQVREALRKSGLTDMQNKTVKSSDWTFQGKGGKPFRDPNVIPRAKALGMMMDNGVSDEDIIKWGGGEETRSKVYRARTTAGPSREGLAAGPADRGYPEQK